MIFLYKHSTYSNSSDINNNLYDHVLHVSLLTFCSHHGRRKLNIKLEKRSPYRVWTQLTQMGISQTGKGWGPIVTCVGGDSGTYYHLRVHFFLELFFCFKLDMALTEPKSTLAVTSTLEDWHCCSLHSLYSLHRA